MESQAHDRTAAPASLLARLYAGVAVTLALQLYRLLILVGRFHAHCLATRSFSSGGSAKQREKVETYPQEALFGYDWYVWRFMLPFMWRADTELPAQMYEATIGQRTIEIGPGSAYFPRRSAALRRLAQRSLVASPAAAGARLSYDLLDLNPIPLQYSHARLERLWSDVARGVSGAGLVPHPPTVEAYPNTRRLAADITSLEQLQSVLAAKGVEQLYDTLVANLVIHCIPYAAVADRANGHELARRKMAAILTGMASLLAPAGSLVGCTVLGPRCAGWTHDSAYSEAAAIDASAMLRRIGIFANEYDTLDAFTYGAKLAGLEISVARVTGNLLTFHLVNSKPRDAKP